LLSCVAVIPETIAYTYRALRIVQKFGAIGCTVGQYGSAAYTSKGAGHNRVASQVLMSLERRGLVRAIGEDPSEARSDWDRTVRSKRRYYSISEAGEAYLEEQVRASGARARELAQGMGPRPAPAPSGEADPNVVGAWDR
jgi:hypothetical protein